MSCTCMAWAGVFRSTYIPSFTYSTCTCVECVYSGWKYLPFVLYLQYVYMCTCIVLLASVLYFVSDPCSTCRLLLYSAMCSQHVCVGCQLFLSYISVCIVCLVRMCVMYVYMYIHVLVCECRKCDHVESCKSCEGGLCVIVM